MGGACLGGFVGTGQDNTCTEFPCCIISAGAFCLLFVLDTPEVGKSSGGSLLGRSIGIAPPRLLYGRAASYGSIFDPVCCHGPDGSSPSFAGGCIALPLRGSWRSGLLGFAFQLHTGTYLMNDYSVVKVLGSLLRAYLIFYFLKEPLQTA